MRALSLTLRAAQNAEQTGEIPIFLVTIEHEFLAEPLRISSDPTSLLSTSPLRYGTLSRSETFNYLPMTLQLPEDSDEAAPAMQLVLDNVGREAMPLIRSVTSPATVTIELVLASAPDIVEALWPEFDLVGARYEAGQLSLELTIDALTSDPYPAGTFTPAGFGGLF